MTTYFDSAPGITVTPGQWRPHFPWEHIAWVSTPWACHDYLWLDIPEALFAGDELLFLSHTNPRHPSQNPSLPAVPWRRRADGIEFERTLSNGVRFAASVTCRGGRVVDLSLFIENGSDRPLCNITLQTCVYLRALDEFNQPTTENKFVHAPRRGWITLKAATEVEQAQARGRYRIGFRKGPPVADLPVMLCRSRGGDRLIAMTWHDHTFSLIGNPAHPCMHADPFLPDLTPGRCHSICGRIAFFDCGLDDLDLSILEK